MKIFVRGMIGLIGLIGLIVMLVGVMTVRLNFAPLSEVTIVNAAAAPIQGGELRIGHDRYELGSLASRARRTFRYRLNRAEGDFGVRASFGAKVVSAEALGYFVGMPWLSDQQFDVIEVNDREVRLVSSRLHTKPGV